jgi:hypothetical protein
VTIAVVPGRGRALAALAAGAAGAALPAAHALTSDVLSTDFLPAEMREEGAAGFGWRLAVGLALAAVLGPALARAWARLGLEGPRGRRLAAGLGAAVVLALAVTAAASPAARDWADDRAAEFRGEGGDAVANQPDRLVSAASNQRKAWWGEAWDGFLDAPIQGQGAGGFALVHLQERASGGDALNTREPHGVALRFLSGTGAVGLGLFALLVGAIAWGVVRAAGRGAAPELGLPLAILAAFAIHASVDWSWAVPALTVPALAAAGVVLAAAGPARAWTGGRPDPLVAGTIAGLTAMAVVSAVLPWWSTRAADAGRDALADGRPRVALERADRARELNPLSVAPLLLRAGALDDLDERGRALGAYEEATRLQPDNPAAWRALAIFLGRDERAAAAWRQVRRLDPQDPEAALRAGA